MFVSELKFSETKLQYVWETKPFSFKTSNLTRNNLRNCGYKIQRKEKKTIFPNIQLIKNWLHDKKIQLNISWKTDNLKFPWTLSLPSLTIICGNKRCVKIKSQFMTIFFLAKRRNI